MSWNEQREKTLPSRCFFPFFSWAFHLYFQFNECIPTLVFISMVLGLRFCFRHCRAIVVTVQNNYVFCMCVWSRATTRRKKHNRPELIHFHIVLSARFSCDSIRAQPKCFFSSMCVLVFSLLLSSALGNMCVCNETSKRSAWERMWNEERRIIKKKYDPDSLIRF